MKCSDEEGSGQRVKVINRAWHKLNLTHRHAVIPQMRRLEEEEQMDAEMRNRLDESHALNCTVSS